MVRFFELIIQSYTISLHSFNQLAMKNLHRQQKQSQTQHTLSTQQSPSHERPYQWNESCRPLVRWYAQSGNSRWQSKCIYVGARLFSPPFIHSLSAQSFAQVTSVAEIVPLSSTVILNFLLEEAVEELRVTLSTTGSHFGSMGTTISDAISIFRPCRVYT